MTPDSGTRATHERSVAVGGAAGPAERVPGAAFQAPEFLSANSGAACRPQDVGQGERLDTPVRWRSLLPPPPSPEHDEEQQGGGDDDDDDEDRSCPPICENFVQGVPFT